MQKLVSIGRARRRCIYPMIALAITGIFVSSCATTPFSESDAMAKYAGAWTGADSASLDLSSDGDFSAHLLPIQLAGPAFWSSPMTGDGTWSVDPAIGQSAEAVNLELPDHGAVKLYPQGSGKSLELMLRAGDRAKDFTMHRRGTAFGKVVSGMDIGTGSALS